VKESKKGLNIIFSGEGGEGGLSYERGGWIVFLSSVRKTPMLTLSPKSEVRREEMASTCEGGGEKGSKKTS